MSSKRTINPMIGLFLLFIVIFAASSTYKGVNYQLQLKNERNKLSRINNPDKVVLNYNKNAINLTKEDQDKILKEFKGKAVVPHHSHSLDEYKVSVTIIQSNQEKFQFDLYPDSYLVGYYWLDMEHIGNFKEIRSKWLMKFFEEKGIFVHENILEK